MNVLPAILTQKRREIDRLPPGHVTPRLIQHAWAGRSPARGFLDALRQPRRPPPALIAEVKKASPSAGLIRPHFDPVAIARDYESAGATCLSVLTDELFFQGSLDFLRQIRPVVQLPLLRKDFILDERQILESVASGADAILLIVAILDDTRLRALHDSAIQAGLTALVEVHNETELDRALQVGATLIGVNNRDLRTFQVDLAATERVAARLQTLAASGPNARPFLVAESGIRTRNDVQRVHACGARAILVGESLMRHPHPAQPIDALLPAASAAGA